MYGGMPSAVPRQLINRGSISIVDSTRVSVLLKHGAWAVIISRVAWLLGGSSK
jgi:hypothetical protein